MSLRVRLLLAAGAVALVALVAADIATYSSLESFLTTQIHQRLANADTPIERALDSGAALSFSTVAHLAPGMFVQVRDAAGEPTGTVDSVAEDGQQISPALPATLPAMTAPASSDGAPRAYFTAPAEQPGGPRFEVRASELVNGAVLILALPLDQSDATLHRLLLVELAVSTLALAGAAGIGWWLVRAGLRPLAEVEEAADAIAEGDLSRRVAEAGENTEVGHLARAFNTMVGRIEEAFSRRDATEAELRSSEERLRRFVADASHELRTPLAAIRAYAELFERGASGRPEDLSRTMSGIRHEAERMGDLVDELLLLARLDEGRPLAREPVELVGIAAKAVDAARALGPDWPVSLLADRPVEITGDPSRLRQVIDNFLANVRHHTPPGTTTTVLVSTPTSPDRADEAILKVTDDGPGIPPQQVEHVFERFYRGDPARARARQINGEHAGSGLGLAIVSAIVAAHGGYVEAESPPGGGASFTVHLPLDGATASAAAPEARPTSSSPPASPPVSPPVSPPEASDATAPETNDPAISTDTPKTFTAGIQKPVV